MQICPLPGCRLWDQGLQWSQQEGRRRGAKMAPGAPAKISHTHATPTPSPAHNTQIPMPRASGLPTLQLICGRTRQ